MSRIVADTSAFVAIFKSEATARQMELLLGRVDAVLVPSVCLVELALLQRIAGDVFFWASKLVAEPPFKLLPLSVDEARLAAEAAKRYGKGAGHAAKLNFGDCLVYAVAKYRDLPLLFAGDDFSHTDIRPALPPET